MAMVGMASAQVPNAGVNAVANPMDINSLLKAEINGEDTPVRAQRRHAITTAVVRTRIDPHSSPGTFGGGFRPYADHCL